MRIPTWIVAVFVLAALPKVAQAYKVKKSSRGTPLRWAEGELEVEIAMSDPPRGVGAAEADGAIRAAFETWAEAVPAAIDVTFSSIAGVPSPNAHDRRNLVRWVHEGWDDLYESEALAVTLTTYDPSSGRITDADIVINAEEYRWHAGDSVDGCAGQYDLQNVITHEVGHLFGLAHDEEHSDATMYPSSPTCETKKRDLDGDDLQGLRYLYEELGPPDAAMAFGCSTSTASQRRGGALALVPAFLALLGLSLLRGRRLRGRRLRVGPRAFARRASVIAAVALASAPIAAEATTARRLSLSELASASDLVARGTVVDQRAIRAGGRVVTDSVIAVDSCWRGTCGERIVVRQLGGEAGGVGLSVEGAATMRVGDEVVAFLRSQRGGRTTPVGMAQGVFRVVRGEDGTIARLTRDTTGLTFVRPDGGLDPGGVEVHDLESVARAARAR